MSRTISVTGISTPAFWLGLLLIYLFYGRLGILPGSGRIASDIPPPHTVTGFYTVDALIAGNWPGSSAARCSISSCRR